MSAKKISVNRRSKPSDRAAMSTLSAYEIVAVPSPRAVQKRPARSVRRQRRRAGGTLPRTRTSLAEARSLAWRRRGDHWSCLVVPLGHHPHAMSLRTEIAEQPEVVQRLLDEGWPEARALGRALTRVEHITLVARGSSDNAATYGKYLFESIAGIVTALSAPSLVTRYQAPPSYAHGAVIGISQSGASPDVAGVVAEGRRAGAVTIAFTNQPRSKLGRAAEHVFALRAGAEHEVAATKTYTATCVALALLAATTAEARGRSALSLAGLAEAVAEAVKAERDAARIARAIGRAPTVIVLGRGYLYPAALETALKVKELARVWAEPYSSADFAHGPRTLLRARTPVVLLSSRGATEGEARSLASSLAERGARVYAITNDERVAEKARDAILLRAPLSETLVPISFVVAGQQLAVALARRHGRDPERPAGLAKVTRTL
ncbi:MAG: SIS domain-containing protein [Chloroflexi bacterium]|nr:MAG: SIS domain-containing protein [Chloroflexota bacterium]